MSGILRLESLTRGNTLKQGDKTPLKYRLFDADGEKLNIAGKTAQVRLVYPDFLTIGYEKDGLTVAQDDTVTFTVDKVIPAKLYHVEIIVDNKFIFPSRADESKFTVDKSSLGTEANIIEVVGVDAVVRKAVDLINDDPNLIIDEDKLVSDIISNTGIGSIEEYHQQFNDVIKELSEDKDYNSLPEIAGARGGFDTLGDRLNDTTAELTQTKQAFNDAVSQVTVDSEVILARGGKTTLGSRIDEIDDTVDAIRDKNYLEGVDLIDGFYVNNADGELIATSTHSVTDFIRLVPERQYIFSNNAGGVFTNSRIAFYDESNTYISGYRIEAGNPVEEAEITVPSNASKARISLQRTNSADYSTWNIRIKDFKVITSLDIVDLQPKLLAGEGLSLVDNELQLDFVETGNLEEPVDGVYNRTDLNDYRNTNQDEYMILEDGSLVTTSATLVYTTTNPIPVSAGEQFSFKYRAIYFADINNNPVGYLPNTGIEKKVFEVPTGATQMIVVARLDMIEDEVIERLTYRDEDVPIKFTRKIQGIGNGTGEAYDQQLNTFNDVKFNSVKTNTLDISGTIPTGTLSSPPSGLLSGDMWADTTDSSTHPIVRVML